MPHTRSSSREFFVGAFLSCRGNSARACGRSCAVLTSPAFQDKLPKNAVDEADGRKRALRQRGARRAPQEISAGSCRLQATFVLIDDDVRDASPKLRRCARPHRLHQVGIRVVLLGVRRRASSAAGRASSPRMMCRSSPFDRRCTITSQLQASRSRLSSVRACGDLGFEPARYLATLLAGAPPQDGRQGSCCSARRSLLAERWAAPRRRSRWRAGGAEGTLRVCHHYGKGREERLSVKLLDDAATYAAQPDPAWPDARLRRAATSRCRSMRVRRLRTRAGRELVGFDAATRMTEVLDAEGT